MIHQASSQSESLTRAPRFLALIRAVGLAAIATGLCAAAQDPAASGSRFSACGESRLYLDRKDRVCMLSGALRYECGTDQAPVDRVPASQTLHSAIRVPLGAEVESLLLYVDDELTVPLRVGGELLSFRPDASVSTEASLAVEPAPTGFQWVGFSAELPAGSTRLESLQFRWAYLLRSYPELAKFGEHTCAAYWNDPGPGCYISQYCRVIADAHSSHAAQLGGAWTSSALVFGCLAGAALLTARLRRRRSTIAQPA